MPEMGLRIMKIWIKYAIGTMLEACYEMYYRIHVKFNV